MTQRDIETGGPSGTAEPDRPRPARMHDVAGKVALITGGDSGIGLGISHAMLRTGMRVIMTYRTDRHLEEARRSLEGYDDRLRTVRLDVTDRATVMSLSGEIAQLFGKLHVLVCNAGVASMLPLSNASFDDWDWCMSVNVGGVFNCIRAFLPHIRAHGEGGHIVATSSMLGGLIAGPYWGVYSASKFAVVGMMEALRSELAATNVGVSVFCPAGVRSNLGSSDRNRPPSLREAGALDDTTLALTERFHTGMRTVLENSAGTPPLMDPFEAGERVLQGIRNDDLYILSHAEYEQALRDRSEALLASLPRGEPPVSPGRIALAQLARNPIYAEAAERRRRLSTSNS